MDVFFALSGWLIGGILIQTQPYDLPRFYFNRALRIWVPYYLALFLIIIASIIKDPINIKWLEFVLYKSTWVYNLFGPQQLAALHDYMPLDGTGNHFWSVNAEEQFYLLSPLLLVIFSRYGRQITTWILLVLLFWYTGRYSAIGFGVLAVLFNHKYPDFHRKPLSMAILLGLFVAASIALSHTHTNQSIQYQAFAPLFAISLILLLARRGKQNPVGHLLGGMSYPLYLNHWIGVFFFNLVLEPFGMRDTLTRQILSVFMNYAIAAFLFWFIERKVLEVRSMLYTRKRGFIFTVLAYSLILIGLCFGLYWIPSFFIFNILLLFTVTCYFVIKKSWISQSISSP